MADFVDKLTDAELRTKLSEYGFPVVPITATTRKTMVKKLKLLIENKNKINTEGRRSLGKYSSGEESDVEVKVESKTKERNRRATMAVGSMLPPTSSAKSKKNDSKKSTSSVNSNDTTNGLNSRLDPKNIVQSSTTSTTTRRIIKTQYVDDENDYSDSDIEIVENKSLKKTRSSPSPPDFTKSDSDHIDDKNIPSQRSAFFSPNNFKTVDTETSNNRLNVFGRASGIRSPTLQPDITSSPSSRNVNTDFFSSPIRSRNTIGSPALDSLNQIRSRLTLNSGPISPSSSSTSSSIYNNRKTIFGTLPSSSGSNTTTGVDSKIETPYFSEFTRRLSQIKKRDDSDNENDIIKESDMNGSQFSRNFNPRYNSDRTFDFSKEFKEFKTSQEKNILKNNVVSFTLLGIACLFFLALSFLYMAMRTDHVPLLDIEVDNLPFCENLKDPSILNRPGVNCVPQKSMDATLALLKILQPELLRRAVQFKCESGGTGAVGGKVAPHMLDATIIEYIQKLRPDINPEKIQSDLYNLQVILLHKPDSPISLIEVKNIYETETGQPVITDPEVLYNRQNVKFALVMNNPDLPLNCLIHLRFYAIAWYTIVITLALFICYVIHYIVKYFLRVNRERNKQIYEMVEQIIDILSRNTGTDNENYMAVSHVRDMIIPIQDRTKMNSIWNAAVQFLENNESRVRSEIQIVSGEEYRVWRWLGNSALNLSSNRGKVWQGQAFDTSQEGSVNSLQFSPTQCLKIRQMVDKNDTTGNWSQVIKDAILEKCGENCNILHIGIDRATCCVYVKCASQQDAGIAYRNLHGWWYDGKLITVKYLRLERYLDRFPDSPTSGPYLKPSNNKKLSLQNDWSSNNEDN